MRGLCFAAGFVAVYVVWVDAADRGHWRDNWRLGNGRCEG